MAKKKTESIEDKMRQTLQVLDLSLTDAELSMQLRDKVSINLLVAQISKFYPLEYSTYERVNFVLYVMQSADAKGVVDTNMGKICLFTLYVKLRRHLNGKIMRISSDEFISLMRSSVIDETVPETANSVKKRVDAVQ